jgi:hypothetical protein
MDESSLYDRCIVRSKRAIIVVIGGCCLLVLVGGAVMLRNPVLEMWYMRRASSGGKDEREDAICRIISISGVRRLPDLMRIWVENIDIEVLLSLDRCLRNRPYEDALVLGFDKEVNTEDGIVRGDMIEVSTEGTVYAMHGLAIINPIALYERRYGNDSWPIDVPLERIKEPVRWRAAEARRQAEEHRSRRGGSP